MFQFPNLFPKFEDTRPVDATDEPAVNGDAERPKDVKPDVKPDIKPTPLQLRGQAKKHGVKPPEGRIGSLVVMKSGRVKMVLGDGIVMNVCPHFLLELTCRYRPEWRLLSYNNWFIWIVKPNQQ